MNKGKKGKSQEGGVSDDPTPVSLSRSLGGLFGLMGVTDTTSNTGSASGAGLAGSNAAAVKASQMRLALCPVKMQWALLLADLGLLKGASAYAREAKSVCLTAVQSTGPVNGATTGAGAGTGKGELDIGHCKLFLIVTFVCLSLFFSLYPSHTRSHSISFPLYLSVVPTPHYIPPSHHKHPALTPQAHPNP